MIMSISIHQETYAFAISLLGGVSIALIYDILRAIRMMMKSNKKVIHLFDIIFWIIAAGMSFYFINIGNDGQIRGFMFIGLIIGWTIYFFIVGKKLVNVICFILNKLFKLMEVIFKIITIPFKFIFKFLAFLITFLIINPFKSLFRKNINKKQQK